MKANFRRLVVLAFFALALNVAASAQSFSHQVRVKIPFSFYAGDKALPAGDYTIAINRQNDNTLIYRTDSAGGMFLLGSPYDVSSNGITLLTFRMNEEAVYVLQKLQGPDIGLSFGTGKTPSRLADSMGDNATQVVAAELVK